MNLSLFDPPPAQARITPRDYQERGIINTINSWDDSPGSLMRLMTGGGKTIVGSLLIDHWLQRGDDYRALVLSHERQLIWQFADEIEDVLGMRPAIEMAENQASGDDLITVASRQTLQVKQTPDGEKISRLFKFDNQKNWLIVIDEAHRWSRGLQSCAPIIEWFEENPNSKRLGLTATPERSDKRSLEQLFPNVASDYRLYAQNKPCAIEDGWAVPYDQRFVVVDGVDFKNIKEVAGDFKDDDLDAILNAKEELAKLITPTLELVQDRRTLTFSPTVSMAKSVALQINAELGWEAAFSLDGSVPEFERKETYRRHQRGDFQFLSVCGLCREGYNDPGIQAVAIFRPTKSRPLAEQMKGRGCRPLRGLVDGLATAEQRKNAIARSSKPNCMIVDLVGVTGLADCASTVHLFAEGKPDEVIEWANNLMVEGETDARVAIQRAEEEIEEERERERERREKLRQARLERERKAKEEAAKRARVQADVNWQDRQVESGGGGVVRGSHGRELATPKQQAYLRRFGIEFDPEYLSKAQASRIIGQHRKGASLEEIQNTNRTKPTEKSKPRNVVDINRMLLEI